MVASYVLVVRATNCQMMKEHVQVYTLLNALYYQCKEPDMLPNTYSDYEYIYIGSCSNNYKLTNDERKCKCITSYQQNIQLNMLLNDIFLYRKHLKCNNVENAMIH